MFQAIEQMKIYCLINYAHDIYMFWRMKQMYACDSSEFIIKAK